MQQQRCLKYTHCGHRGTAFLGKIGQGMLGCSTPSIICKTFVIQLRQSLPQLLILLCSTPAGSSSHPDSSLVCWQVSGASQATGFRSSPSTSALDKLASEIVITPSQDPTASPTPVEDMPSPAAFLHTTTVVLAFAIPAAFLVDALLIPCTY
jgi:hypothetical protein